MINNNFKIALFGALIVVMVLPFTVDFTSTASAATEPEPEGLIPESERLGVMSISEFKGPLPKIITETETLEQNSKAIFDKKVSKLLGKHFVHHSTAQYFEDGVWEPVISFTTDNGKNIVTVEMKNGKVVGMEKYETHEWGHSGRGFAAAEYDSPYTARGMGMNLDVPAYSHSAGSWTALLVNAVKDGSTGNLCNPNHMPNTYWAQSGLEFSSNGVRVGFADTGTYCTPAFLPMPFSTGDDVTFQVYVDDANDDWYMWMHNNSVSSSPPYAYVRHVPNSAFVDSSHPNTNVFFENQNTHTVNWDPGFTSGDFTVDWASFQWTNNNWYYWSNDNQTSFGCHPGATAAQLMSGSFGSSSHDVTFDVSNMDSLCGRS
jgi:hypothetical protein